MTATLQTQLKPASTLMSSSFTAVRRGLLQRKCDCGGTPGPSGECEDCRKKPLSLQRKTPNSELGTRNDFFIPPIIHEVLHSADQPLDAKTRGFMEPRFGHDFSQVRVQGGAPPDIQTKLTTDRPGDQYEKEAERVAEQVMRMTGPGTAETAGRPLPAQQT